LVALHHAGGGSASFSGWRTASISRAEIVALELPGRGSQITLPPFLTWKPAVDAIDAVLADLDPLPTVLFGHSMGAVLAFELARRPSAVTRHSLLRIIASSLSWPPGENAKNLDRGKSDSDFIKSLRAIGGLREEVVQNKELLELILPTLRADVELVQSYVYKPGAAISCALSAWGGKTDPIVSADELAGWRTVAGNTFDMRLFEGGHFYFQEAPQPVLTALAALVKMTDLR
jgi:medium-chain acyl-[acyl-carrier-protein] hydrolase